MTAGTSNYSLKNISNPALTALIIINAVVFIVLAATSLTSSLEIAETLCLSSDPTDLIGRPWSLASYSFTQANALHLLFNMLWLYSFGRLFAMSQTQLRLIAVYLIGAIAGGVVFVLFSSIFGSNASGWLMGSSAAVIAVAVAVAMIMPDRELNLPLLGPTKIKWIVAVVVVLFCIGLSAPNAGGNLAHLGGAAAGAVYGAIISRRGKAPERDNEYGVLVQKIKCSGYDALTQREKRRFFELSSRRNSK